MVDKKAVESKYIYEVKEQYPDFPDGKIRDFESPDFLIEDGAKTVGLEVTRYYRKQPDRDINNREIEAYQDIILSKAQELFQKENKTPLLVSPSWMFKHKLTRNEINLLANTLVDIINNNIPEDTRKPNIIYHRDLVTTLLANYCSRISIMKLEKAPRWVSFGAGFTYVEISEIQNIISEKALKILF